MSHQRRVPFLLSSTNSHKHSPFAHWRMRLRPLPTIRSAADQTTGASRTGIGRPAPSMTSKLDLPSIAGVRARQPSAFGGFGQRLAQRREILAADRLAASQRAGDAMDRLAQGDGFGEQLCSLGGMCRGPTPSAAAATWSGSETFVSAHASTAAKSVRFSTGGALPRQANVLAKARQRSSPVWETSIVPASGPLWTIDCTDLTCMPVDGVVAGHYKYNHLGG